MGIGFAIPVNMVRTVITAAKSGTSDVKRAWIGASLQAVTREIADSLSLQRPVGALVSDVVNKGPADEAGLRRGDVIIAVDKRSVDDPEAFGYRIATRPLGTEVTLSVLRAGQTISLPIKLVPPPEEPRRERVEIGGNSPFTGASFVNLSPATQDELSIDGFKTGVAVERVQEDSIASSWLQKGDVILSVNGVKISRTTDVRDVAASRPTYWKVSIGRDGQVLTSVFR